jgi:hypothetical protein
MKKIQFQYHKTPENITNREAIVLSKPTDNYFTVDMTELDDSQRQTLEKGLVEYDKKLQDLFSLRNEWLRDSGFASYFRNFNKDKMSSVI